MDYKPSGVCSKMIHVELDGETVKKVEFEGGCDGNTTGITRLIEGMNARDAINRLEGVKCGFKSTSCPDQLSKALKKALGEA